MNEKLNVGGHFDGKHNAHQINRKHEFNPGGKI